MSPAQLASLCASGDGARTLAFSGTSKFYVGTAPAPPTTTTTLAPTTTTLPVTTTTFNPIPPAAVTAIAQACAALAATLAENGVDIGTLYVACVTTVNGGGPTLLTLFLTSPSLGCLAFAGVPGLSDPQVIAACIQFANAVAPYSSILAGLIPPP